MTSIEDLARRVVRLESALAQQHRASRLGSSSLDDTALAVRGPGGGLRAIIGQQADGTTALNVVNGGPPPTPSTPTAAPALGGIAATWDGTFADGAAAPLDWSRVEVHTSPTNGFTPGADTLQATIETPQGASVYVPAADPQYVVLLARNTSGTASSATGQVGPYAPRPIVDTDVADGSITETKIAVDAVTTPKIKAGAIQTAQLDALAVTTAKLAAGSVDATALKADAITGKTITGGVITGAIVQTSATDARAILDSAEGALKIYDADENVTNYVGGPDNLIWNQNNAAGEWVAMQVGNFLMGVGDASNPDDRLQNYAGLLGVMAVGFGATWMSPSARADFTEKAGANLLAGRVGGQSGSVNSPALQMNGDIAVTGTVVKRTTAFDQTAWRNVPEKRRPVTMAGGWATGPGISGSYPPLVQWLDAMDNLRIFGTFHATTTAPGTTIGTGLTPVNMTSLGGVGIGGNAVRLSAGAATMPIYINGAGGLLSAFGPTIAVNDTFAINATVPLGNIA